MMKTARVVAFSLFVLYASTVCAQTHEWSRQLTSGAGEKGWSASADGLGSVYIVGRTLGTLGESSAGSFDAFITKYDDTGVLQWTQQLGTHDRDWALDVSADGLGSVYISGATLGSLEGPNLGGWDAFVSKYDDDGALQWTRQLGTSLWEGGQGVSADGLGNVYISGWTTGNLDGENAGREDAFVSKYDDAGTHQWTRQLGTDRDDGAFDVSADGLGNVYISGRTDGRLLGNTAFFDAFVSKYDDDGEHQWTREIGTANNFDWAESRGVSADGLGNVYISGFTNGSLDGPIVGGADVFLSKYDDNGMLQWTRQLGTSGLDEGLAVSADGLGNVYIAGLTEGGLEGTNAGSADAFISSYDASGTHQWTRQLGSSDWDESFGVSADGLGGVYIAGSSWGDLGGPNVVGAIHAFVTKYTIDLPESTADFDGDGDVDHDDVDALVGEIVAGTHDSVFDLSADGAVNHADLSQWLTDAARENGFSAPYLFGDANLDGSVNSADLNKLALNWQSQDVALWSAGDFTADGLVNSADLNELALNWQQSIPSAASPATVAEPSGLAVFYMGAFLAALTRWQRKHW